MTMRVVKALDPGRKVAVLTDGTEFLSGPKPTSTFQAPSAALVAEKVHFGATRLQRWFERARQTTPGMNTRP